MIIDYQPRGVCSRRMTLEVEEGVIRSIRIQGGCDGNLQGISRLVEGMEVSEAIRRLDGIRCGGKPTSCPDQLAQALKQYKGGVRDTGTHGVPVSLRLGEPVKLGNLLVRQLCRVQGERLAIVAYRPCELSDIIEAPVIGHAQEDPEPVSLCSENNSQLLFCLKCLVVNSHRVITQCHGSCFKPHIFQQLHFLSGPGSFFQKCSAF